MLTYMGPLLVVDDIARSRHFYEQLLGQKVKYDLGPNVAFEGDWAIHLEAHYRTLLGDATRYRIARKAHNVELCFETDEIGTLGQRLKLEGIEFIHGIQEQPWGQRVMRLYDPDGHILEVGETMGAVVWRLRSQGLSLDQIREKTSMPREFVEQALRPADGVDEANDG